MIRTRPARPVIRPVDRAAGAGVALVDLLLVTTLPSSTFAADRDLAGHWTGTVQVPGQELELDVDLRSGTDGWSGDITIPAQSIRDLPLERIEVEGDSVRFAIPGIPGEPTFEGKLAATSSRAS